MRRPRVCWNEPSKHPVQRGDGKFLGCRIQPLRGATCDFCATCDFWTLQRDSCIKSILQECAQARPGQPRRDFRCADAVEKPLRRERRTHVIGWDEEEESESDVRLRVERMIAQGKAHRYDRFFFVLCRGWYPPVARLLCACSGGGGIRFFSTRSNR